jgi:hypothetical protein
MCMFLCLLNVVLLDFHLNGIICHSWDKKSQDFEPKWKQSLSMFFSQRWCVHPARLWNCLGFSSVERMILEMDFFLLFFSCVCFIPELRWRSLQTVILNIPTQYQSRCKTLSWQIHQPIVIPLWDGARIFSMDRFMDWMVGNRCPMIKHWCKVKSISELEDSDSGVL